MTGRWAWIALGFLLFLALGLWLEANRTRLLVRQTESRQPASVVSGLDIERQQPGRFAVQAKAGSAIADIQWSIASAALCENSHAGKQSPVLQVRCRKSGELRVYASVLYANGTRDVASRDFSEL